MDIILFILSIYWIHVFYQPGSRIRFVNVIMVIKTFFSEKSVGYVSGVLVRQRSERPGGPVQRQHSVRLAEGRAARDDAGQAPQSLRLAATG